MYEVTRSGEASFLLCKGVCFCADGGWVTSLLSPLSGNQCDFRAVAAVKV